MRKLALSAAAASMVALGVAVAPTASAIETFDPCMPHTAWPRVEFAGSWLYYPAQDAYSRNGNKGQLRDLNGDGWICAWTPKGFFDPTITSPLVVRDNAIPVHALPPA